MSRGLAWTVVLAIATIAGVCLATWIGWTTVTGVLTGFAIGAAVLLLFFPVKKKGTH